MTFVESVESPTNYGGRKDHVGGQLLMSLMAEVLKSEQKAK